MQNNIAVQTHSSVPHSNPSEEARFRPLSKAYGSASATKALGGSQENNLGTWMEEARAYSRAVMSGEAKRPAPEAWYEFLYQMDWASQKLYGSSDASGAYAEEWGDWSEEAEAPSVNNFGGEAGPDGNYNYDSVETHIGFTGDETRNDVYGTDNSIDLDMPSAQVSTEMTQDHGVPVLKVVVTTSKGTAVYYYDNYASPDFKLDINIPDVSKVSGLASLPTELQAKVHAKKYVPHANSENSIPESSVPGTPVEGQENTYYYEGTVGETLGFTPQGSGVKDEITTHDVYGDANISVKTSDTVHVTKAPAGSDYDLVITVKHKDGSIDEFHVRDAFKTNINAVEDFISFDLDGDGAADTVDAGKVPAELKEFLTLNKSGGDDEAVSAHPEDTAPDSTEYNTAHYNQSANVDIHANYEDEIAIHRISAPGTVTIHGADYSDTMQLDYDEATRTWTVLVYKGGDTTQAELFEIKGGPNTKVVLDVMGQGSIVAGSEIDNVQLGLDGAAASTDGAATRGEALPSREQIVAGLPSYITNNVNMQELVTLFDAAAQSDKPEDWQKFVDKLKGMDPRHGNDAIRSLVTAFSQVVGGDYAKLKEMMDLIPADVRQEMVDVFGRADDGWDRTDDELDERREGEIWNSQDTRDILKNSLED